MVEFCGVLGMPAMHLKTFQKKEFNIVRKAVKAAENVLERSKHLYNEKRFLDRF